MKRALSLLTGLVIAFTMNTSFAQSSVFDLPASKNTLVNYAIEFLKSNPDKDSLTQFNTAFALQIRNVKNKSALFASANQAFLQISQKTFDGAKNYLQTGSYGNYFPANQSTENFRVFTLVQDERLRNMAVSFPLSSGLIGSVMSQLHALTDSEFAVFSADFIQTLKTTRNQMPEINTVRLESFVQDSVASNKDYLDEASPENKPRLLESMKASAKKRFAEGVAANATVGTQILRELVAVTVAQENRGTLDGAGLKTQRVRALTLMIAAIKETGLYDTAQAQEISASVKLFTDKDFDMISDKAFKKAMKEAYLSKEVVALTLELKSLAQ